MRMKVGSRVQQWRASERRGHIGGRCRAKRRGIRLEGNGAQARGRDFRPAKGLHAWRMRRGEEVKGGTRWGMQE